MKFNLLFLFVVLIASCSEKSKSQSSALQATPIQGTWQLISETKIENSDTTFSVISPNQTMIKILNETHFSFLRHDLNKGKDSVAVFVAGGGRYTLKDNQYTEYLDYCNFREWEGNSFVFTVAVQNDTLTQQGREKVEGTGIDRIIIEKYFKVK